MLTCPITGAVLEVRRETYPSGDPYHVARLLVGKSDVVAVTLNDRTEGARPMEGDVVTINARISAYSTKRGEARLNITAESIAPALDPAQFQTA